MASLLGKRAADKHDDAPAPKRRLLNLRVTDEVYQDGMKWVKAQRPRFVDPCCKADIVALQLFLRREKAERQRKRKGTITQQVAGILGRNRQLCGDTWKDFVLSKQVKPPPAATSRGVAHYKIKHTAGLRSEIQLWLRERNAHNKRTVCRDVVRFLIDQKQMPGNSMESERSTKSALELVRRYLVRHGFVRGTVKGNKTYREKEHIIEQRNRYICEMITAIKTRRIVYMDESYIHEHYSRHMDTLVDPTDTVPRPRKRGHKGRRYCFIGALLSGNPLKLPDAWGQYDHPEFMLDTLEIFEGGKKQTKDYHGMFDHTYFYNWMCKLLAMLQHRKIENAIIVMDNAKYHKVKPHWCPRKSWTKAKMLEYCRANNIEVDAKDVKTVVWEKHLKAVADATMPIICEMARQAGHEVRFSPPHYSDLQPIELVWAIVKGEVGRQYDDETTFKITLERLRKAFNGFQSRTAGGCIKKSEDNLTKLYNEVFEEDNEADSGELEEENEESDTIRDCSEDDWDSADETESQDSSDGE